MVALYPYQEEAVQRILDRKKLLLAYEMGLGKTPLSIVAMERLMETDDVSDTVLVVVLASLKYQWEAEVHVWAPESTAIVIDGTPKQRKKLFDRVDEECPDYVIVNYELVTKEFAWFSSRRWGAIIADEATAIKGFRSKRSKALKLLASRVPVRLALTGTPISNGKPEEIYSLMEMVDPAVLGRFDVFDRTFIVRNGSGWVERYRNLDALHDTLEPVVARKRQLDEDVREYLPDVIDAAPTRIEWDHAGWNLYAMIANSLISVLDEAMEEYGSSFSFNVSAHYGHADVVTDAQWAIVGQIMTRLQALRMLCSHPDVLRASATRFNPDEEGGQGGAYAAFLLERGELEGVTKGPKVDFLVPYLRDFLELDPEHKVVVFSSFRESLPVLESALSFASPRMFHGGMNAKEKNKNKLEFQNDPTSRVLISSDAGGFGVNLPEASLLVNYDLPWTAGAASQRDSRIIRASSRWPSVRLDRLLMANSVEERQWDSLRHKMAVSEAVLEGAGIDKSGGVMSTVGSLRDTLIDSL